MYYYTYDEEITVFFNFIASRNLFKHLNGATNVTKDFKCDVLY